VIDRTIRDVEDAVERLRFNIAIAKLMEALPNLRSHSSKRVLIRLLAPLAPYLAEELWQRMGEPFSVHAQPWPEWSEHNVAAEIVTVVVQIDGKVRATLEVPADASEEQMREAALASGNVRARLEDREVAKVIAKPPKLISFVTKTPSASTTA
jgi:leucyl-tRNA synthetase